MTEYKNFSCSCKKNDIKYYIDGSSSNFGMFAKDIKNIAFVQEDIRERFGIMLLSAMIPKWRREVFVKTKNYINEILSFKPDVVALSTQTAGLQFALDTARKIKERDKSIFIIMGGAHPTFYPEIINEKNIDCIFQGESLLSFKEFCDTFNSNINNNTLIEFYYKKVIKQEKAMDINLQPLPDYDLYYKKFKSLAMAETKRVYIAKGCPYQCSYCFNGAYNKMYESYTPQLMNPEIAVSQIEWLDQHYGFKYLHFIMDTMNLYKDQFVYLLELYHKRIGKPYLCNVRANLVDEYQVEVMKKTGCVRVDFGVEHGDYQIRNNILKRNMLDTDIIKAGLLFKKYGIRVQTTNIVGTPLDSVEKSIKTIELNQMIEPEMAKAFLLQPYEKTDIYEYCKKNDLLQNMDDQKGTGFQLGQNGMNDKSKIKLVEEKELIRLHLLFNFFVQNPGLNKFIKIIVKFPFNKIYRIINVLPFLLQDIKYTGKIKKKVVKFIKMCYFLIKV